MNNNIIRWGVIGLGKVTELKSVPAYLKTEGFRISAVMARQLSKAKNFANKHQIPLYFDNADTLIQHPEVDAIYIATPPDSHLHYALKVAQAGKPCCIEKPLATHYQAALQINQAFEQAKQPLFVAYYRRSLPRFAQIQQWLTQQEIGQVRQINWLLTKTPSPLDLSGDDNWRTDATIAPGGYFDDLASHGLNLFCQWFGNIENVNAIADNQMGLYTAKDAISASWQHQSGVIGSGVWNFGCDRRDDKVEIFGEKGKISFSVFADNPIQLSNERGELNMVIDNPENIQLYHCKNMQRHLTGQLTHPSMGTDAVHTNFVLEQMITSKT